MGSLVTAGMMGGLALLLANLTGKQQAVQRNAETQFEITAMFNRIVRALYDRESCNRTLGIGSIIEDGRSIDFIRDKDGDVVFNTTDQYGNRLLRIQGMTLENTNIIATRGEVALRVEVLKLNRSITGFNEVSRVFPISVEVTESTTTSPDNNLVNCNYVGENLTQIADDVVTNDIVPIINNKTNNAKRDFCIMLGGTFDTTGLTCSFSGVLPPPIGGSDSDDGTSLSPEANRHFDPPVSIPEGEFCSQPEYMCLDSGTSVQRSDCGVKLGSRSVTSMGLFRYNASACYIPQAAHTFQTGTGTTCENATDSARSLSDPGNLATTSSTAPPLGHFEGKVYCDSDCSFDGTTYSMRCRLFVRGVAWRCTYICR